jgi:hypothetical protein
VVGAFDRVVPIALDVKPDHDEVLACTFAVDPANGYCLPSDDCEDGHMFSHNFSVTVPRFNLEVYVASGLPLPPVPTSAACPDSIPACTGAPIPAAWSSWEQVVDWALNEASCLLEGVQNPPADVNCCVALRRSGPVGFFTGCGLVGGAVVGDSQLDCVQDDIPGDVKIVASIKKSNGKTPGGSTDSNGDIVLDITKVGCGYSSWAHELGHREGLSHVGSCDCSGTCCNTPQCQCASPPNPDERRIMFCTRCSGVRLDTFTAAECSEFSENAK